MICCSFEHISSLWLCSQLTTFDWVTIHSTRAVRIPVGEVRSRWAVKWIDLLTLFGACQEPRFPIQAINSLWYGCIQTFAFFHVFRLIIGICKHSVVIKALLITSYGLLYETSSILRFTEIELAPFVNSFIYHPVTGEFREEFIHPPQVKGHGKYPYFSLRFLESR